MDLATQMIYCIVHGVTAGAYRGMLVVVAIDVMGMEKFVLGYGVQLLSMGSAMIIGPTVTGIILSPLTLLPRFHQDTQNPPTLKVLRLLKSSYSHNFYWYLTNQS